MGIFERKTKPTITPANGKVITNEKPVASAVASDKTQKNASTRKRDTAASTPQSPQKSAQPAISPTPQKPKQQDYGIEKAIALMRTLPQDSVELVVQVVKQTLESTNVDIGAIIDDATEKQSRIDTRIAQLKEEIGKLESEVGLRSEEIGKLQKFHTETSMVKERLQLAEKLDRDQRPKIQQQ